MKFPPDIFNAGRRLALRGDISAAVDVYVDGLYACLNRCESPLIYGVNEVSPILLQRAAEPDGSKDLLLIEACATIAEDLTNCYGDFAMGDVFLRKKAALQARWQARLGRDRTIYLGQDWVRNIGHIGSLAYMVKLQLVGKAPWDRIVVVCSEERVANLPFLQMFAPFIELRTDAESIATMLDATSGAGFRQFDLIRFDDNRVLHLIDAYNLMEHFWRSTGRNALLALPPQTEERGAILLERLGLPKGAWFVCMHVRDGGYHGDFSASYRNADIATYFEAVSLVKEHGGYVIRLGDNRMTALPELPHLIDYAHSPHRTPELDVYLTAACRFMIATDSGPMYMSSIFGKPALATNFGCVFGPPPIGSTSRFLPKLIEHNGRILSFKEMLSEPWRRARYQISHFDKIGAKYVANSAEDIKLGVAEMLRGGDASPLQQRFTRLSSKGQELGDAVVCSAFVSANAHLFAAPLLDRGALATAMHNAKVKAKVALRGRGKLRSE